MHGQGIEIDEKVIYECVAQGLSVFQQDIDTGLSEYVDKFFDYVILHKSFQQVKKPDFVLKEALRVGKKSLLVFQTLPTTKLDFKYFLAERFQ